jgi:hypothetical protein
MALSDRDAGRPTVSPTSEGKAGATACRLVKTRLSHGSPIHDGAHPVAGTRSAVTEGNTSARLST